MKLRKRNDGYWTTQVKVGKGKYKSVYGKTQRECREKANALIAEVETDTYLETDRITVRQWFEKWESDYALDLSEGSLKLYKSLWRIYVLPKLGDDKLQDVDNSDVQALMSKMSAEGKSPSYMRTTRVCMSRVFRDSIRAGLRKDNPCTEVTTPKIKNPERVVLTDEEVKRFVEAVRNRAESEILEFMLLTGLRVGEALGVTFDRYDRETRTLTVDRQQMQKSKKFSPPKYGKTRKIVLCERAAQIMEDRMEYNEKRRKSNPKYNETDYAFTKLNGDTISRSGVRYKLKEAAKEIGKPGLRVHDLRHTYASLALSAGVDPKTLQENLGHHSAAFTLDVYAHSTEEMKRDAAEKFGSLFPTE